MVNQVCNSRIKFKIGGLAAPYALTIPWRTNFRGSREGLFRYLSLVDWSLSGIDYTVGRCNGLISGWNFSLTLAHKRFKTVMEQ